MKQLDTTISYLREKLLFIVQNCVVSDTDKEVNRYNIPPGIIVFIQYVDAECLG